MNEQLTVKNFGPIKDATVDFKRVTVFIGPTGGGKSTLAKLAAVFRDRDFLLDTNSGQNENAFQDKISQYELTSFLEESTHVKWESDITTAEFIGQILTLLNNIKILGESRKAFFSRMVTKYNVPYPEDENIKNIEKVVADKMNIEELRYALKNIYSKLSWIHYIPAERSFLSAINGALAGIMNEQIALPRTLLQFAEDFEVARLETHGKKHAFFQGMLYIFHEEKNKVILPSGKTIPLNEAASGIQSVIPMMTLVESTTLGDSEEVKRLRSSFIIEEPELNLFPTAQQEILNWLTEKCTKINRDLTITTHSPYLLAHLNTLLFAHQVAQNHPERADEVAKIVPRESWLDPKEFAAYHVEGQKENGVRSIVNPETGLISYNGLDATASAEATEFEKLLDINAGLAVEW